jgi:hypothetical protein
VRHVRFLLCSLICCLPTPSHALREACKEVMSSFGAGKTTNKGLTVLHKTKGPYSPKGGHHVVDYSRNIVGTLAFGAREQLHAGRLHSSPAGSSTGHNRDQLHLGASRSVATASPFTFDQCWKKGEHK